MGTETTEHTLTLIKEEAGLLLWSFRSNPGKGLTVGALAALTDMGKKLTTAATMAETETPRSDCTVVFTPQEAVLMRMFWQPGSILDNFVPRGDRLFELVGGLDNKVATLPGG